MNLHLLFLLSFRGDAAPGLGSFLCDFFKIFLFRDEVEERFLQARHFVKKGIVDYLESKVCCINNDSVNIAKHFTIFADVSADNEPLKFRVFSFDKLVIT